MRHGKSLLAALLACGLLAPAPALARVEQPLARYETALCPGVFGLTLETAEIVIDRIRHNALGLGLKLDQSEQCQANLIVAFVEDGQGYIQQLAADQPSAFGTMSLAEKRALTQATGPVRTLQTTQTQTRDGMPVVRQENLTQIPQTTMWMAHSRIYTPIRRDIRSTMVLIDRDAAANIDLSRLADYATVRGLAEQHPPVAADGSILTLFDSPETAPATLSGTDRAYLASLYGSIPNLPASAHLARFARERTEAE
ncbi:hypothetical protein GRI97_02210 [Altererythrobacter xixiisoli]|uniref:Uncharacterized protein n=1 Tax=Croceibacterium xixiisoli TaxID=1476466 RepID=A0A6I4TRN5_9SPHN|nr:hypothetical protein [Croceibacterium xixiisoli]MXO97801.1 hypothetical protein [Croceibacterium xixiisoli]